MREKNRQLLGTCSLFIAKSFRNKSFLAWFLVPFVPLQLLELLLVPPTPHSALAATSRYLLLMTFYLYMADSETCQEAPH